MKEVWLYILLYSSELIDFACQMHRNLQETTCHMHEAFHTVQSNSFLRQYCKCTVEYLPCKTGEILLLWHQNMELRQNKLIVIMSPWNINQSLFSLYIWKYFRIHFVHELQWNWRFFENKLEVKGMIYCVVHSSEQRRWQGFWSVRYRIIVSHWLHGILLRLTPAGSACWN